MENVVVDSGELGKLGKNEKGGNKIGEDERIKRSLGKGPEKDLRKALGRV